MSIIPFGFWGNRNYAVDGLKLYYDFATTACYPGSGSTVYNLAKNDFNGTIDGATFDGTDGGGCFSFDGVNDAIKPSPLSFFNGELWGPNQSVEIWMKTTATTIMRPYGVFDTLSTPIGTARIYAAINQGPTFSYENGKIYSQVGDNDSGSFNARELNANYNTGISNGSWHQLVQVFENTDTETSVANYNQQARIYIDGVEVTTYYVATGVPAITNAITYGPLDYNIWLGGSNSRNTLGGPYNGKIGVFRYYNRGLTDYEVSLNFNQYKTRYGL